MESEEALNKFLCDIENHAEIGGNNCVPKLQQRLVHGWTHGSKRESATKRKL